MAVMAMNIRRNTRDWLSVDVKFRATMFGLDEFVSICDKEASFPIKTNVVPRTSLRHLSAISAPERGTIREKSKAVRYNGDQEVLPMVLNISAKTCTVLNRPCKL
jgi:hypothetical protein